MNTTRVASSTTAGRRPVTVRAGLFGGGGSKPKTKAPAKKSSPFSFGSKPKPKPVEKKSSPFSFGSKPKPKPVEKKSSSPFSFGSKPKAAPAKKKAAAPAKKSSPFSFGSKPKAPPKKKAGTLRAGTVKKVAPVKKKAPAKPKKAAASSDGELPFFGKLDGGVLFKGGDEKYNEKVDKSSKAKGAQLSIGYKGSGQKGSAPEVDAQGRKARFGGVAYRYADKYGGNIDEYSPIFLPENRVKEADTYEPGLVGLAVWLAGFVGLLAVGGFAIYSTSALA